MSKTAYNLALSSEALRKAWSTLRKRSNPNSRKSSGIDGISIDDFITEEKSLLNRLVQEVRQQKFSFSALYPVLIPKTNNKDRLICIPTVRDRIVQRTLLNHLEIKYAHKLTNSISYGFIKERGVKKAVHEACRLRSDKNWVYKTDITSFFDTIDRFDLYESTKRVIRERSLHAILLQVINSEIAIDNKRQGVSKRIAKLGIKRGIGIRQGMPLSPFFSNVMLHDFDRKIEQRGYSAVRYADDLIFFASSERECLEISHFCVENLEEIGLSIPPIEANSKSTIYNPNEIAEFLGVGLTRHGSTYHLELLPDQITNIRSRLLEFGSIPMLNSKKISLANLGYKLRRTIHGYIHAYDMCSNVDDLSKELLELEQKVLRKLYMSLGIHIPSLTAEQKTFLCLR